MVISFHSEKPFDYTKKLNVILNIILFIKWLKGEKRNKINFGLAIGIGEKL